MSDPVVVQVTHHFTSPADRVFDAWVNPAVARRFLFATRTGVVMECTIDAQVGGHFVVTDRRPMADGDESIMDVEHQGTYLALDRPNRLAFEFSVPPYTQAPTRVDIEIHPAGPGACDLQLTHDLGDSDDAKVYEEQTRKGWTTMLAALETELRQRRVGIS